MTSCKMSTLDLQISCSVRTCFETNLCFEAFSVAESSIDLPDIVFLNSQQDLYKLPKLHKLEGQSLKSIDA